MHWRFIYEQTKVSYTYFWDMGGKHTIKESISVVSTIEKTRVGQRLVGVIGVSLYIQGTGKRPV